jgi:hypothetical protein
MKGSLKEFLPTCYCFRLNRARENSSSALSKPQRRMNQKKSENCYNYHMKTTTLPLRNSMNRLPLRYGFLLIPLEIVCLGLSPTARAVTPAPDGGYPGQNTAEGTNALFSLTTGFYNTAIGFEALYSSTSAPYNTAVGANALYSNTDGFDNVANGAFALCAL